MNKPKHKRRASDRSNPDLRNNALSGIPKNIPRRRADDQDTEKILHELQVHKIELEMQNEEIRSLQWQTQAALDRYIDLYDFAPVGYLTLSAEGRISALNLTAASMLGEKRDKILGRSLADYITDMIRLHDYLARIPVSDGSNVTEEFQILQSRKKTIDVQLEGCITKKDQVDAVNAMSLVIIDISKRKSLEKKLQVQKLQMESLLKNQVALQTATTIARDLNQPLTALSLFSEVAAKYLHSDSITLPALQEALDGIIEQAHRAGESLNELNQFLESDEIYREPIDLNRIILDTLDRLRYEGFISDTHFTRHLESNLPPALCNHMHIRKVLDNLLSNSVEATQEISDPCIIIITTKTITLFKESMIQVTIQDNGTALDTETVTSIFDPFFTTKQQRLGMGLPISQALVEANGGKLWCDTASTLMTSFHFTLPIQDVTKTTQTPKASGQTHTACMNYKETF